MKRLLISWSVLASLPLFAACGVFQTNPVPPEPNVTGLHSQHLAWRNAVHRSPDGQATFRPLQRAETAVDKAESQQSVDEFDSDAFDQAKAQLNKARETWDEIAEDRNPDVDKLGRIANQAHEAERLAQIAQYTAQRELNVAQLQDLQSQQQQDQLAQGDGSQMDSQELIGKHVVPEMLGQLQFQEGTAQLTSESHQVIERLAELVKAHPQLGVGIFGFTSDQQPSNERLEAFVEANPKLKQQDLDRDQKVKAYQQGLSDARAQDVAQLLVQAGISSRRIGARGMGSSHPIASNDTTQGQRQNARVEAIMVPLRE